MKKINKKLLTNAFKLRITWKKEIKKKVWKIMKTLNNVYR